MAAKRESPTRPGSVRERADRPGYEARVRLPNGVRPSRYVKTKREGWAWITEKLAEATQGVYVAHDTRKTGDILMEWLTDVAPKTLIPNSLYNYRRCIQYVLPWLGDIKIGDLKRPHIERTFAGLERGDRDQRALSRSTLNLTFRVLKMALEYCVDADYITRNPMHRMSAPRTDGPRDRVLTIEEIKSILEAAHATRWYAAFVLLGVTGLRVSELLGLEWKNVDLQTGRLRVERQTGRVYGQPGVRLGPLKSRAATRTLIIPQFARQVLQYHQDVQRLERRRADETEGWQDYGVVFCSPTGGLYFRSQFDAEFKRIADTLGINGATPHTFRHTVATLIQEQGVMLPIAKAQLGHASERTTVRIYSHLPPTGLEAVAQVMQGLFADGQGAPLTPLTGQESR